MPLETDADILGMFDVNDHASAGIYTPAGEAPLAVSVILDREEGPSVGQVGIQAAGWRAMLPAAQVPDRLQRGELLSVGAMDFTVETATLETAGAIWTLTLRRG